MLHDQPGTYCHPCYHVENGKKNLDIVSDRIFYIRELKHVPFDNYELGHHHLKVIDVRWTNLCNFACVYCGPEFSSRWAQDLGISPEKPGQQQIDQFKNYIFEHSSDLDHVYLAGGEPLLMKENLELLLILKEKNPACHIRVNTNLSRVDTKVFDLICEFENVHWTVSMEAMGAEFEYIRYGGSWTDFVYNLQVLKDLPHKITFNMLWFLLNYNSLFSTVDWLSEQGFHANSFVIGPLLRPDYLNIRHLPDSVLQCLASELKTRLDLKPGFLLEDSCLNLLNYIQTPMSKNITQSLNRLRELDIRRNLDSKSIFPDLYNLIKD